MKHLCLHQRRIITVAMVVLLVAGCAGSSSANVHEFNPVQDERATTGGTFLQERFSVAVGPVHVPDQLNRPQMDGGGNDVTLSQFNRWSGSLEGNVVRVLLEDLAIRLPNDRYAVLAAAPYPESRHPASYRIELLVDRLQGTAGGALLLNARWQIFCNDGRSVLARESVIREPVNGGGVDAVVAAISKAIGRLSTDIAGGIASVSR